MLVPEGPGEPLAPLLGGRLLVEKIGEFDLVDTFGEFSWTLF